MPDVVDTAPAGNSKPDLLRGAGAFLIAVLSLAACAAIPHKAGIPSGEKYRTNYSDVVLFADSGGAVSDERINHFKLLTGKAPAYWGRYICNQKYPELDLSPGELAVFARNGLRPILILAPFQRLLSQGAGDAQTVAACFATQLAKLKRDVPEFAFPDDTMIFLDVEAGWTLSPSFLDALVASLRDDGVLHEKTQFGIYLPGYDSQQVRDVINSEIAKGAPISAIWFARYDQQCGPLPYWEDANIPAFGTVNVSKEFWQYAAECQYYTPNWEQIDEFDLSAAKPPIYNWTPTNPVRTSGVENVPDFSR